MTKCYYLTGENIRPRTVAEARKLKGCRVKYLRNCDIDKSGRGYFFPRDGTIVDALRSNIEFENQWFVCRSDIVEMVLLPNKDPCD